MAKKAIDKGKFIHSKCGAWKERDGGGTLVCSRSPEHVTWSNPERRKHFDPGWDETWSDEEAS